MFKILIIEDKSNNLESIRRAIIDYGSFANEDIHPRVSKSPDYLNHVKEYAKNKDFDNLKTYITNTIEENQIEALIVDLRLTEKTVDALESEGMQLINLIKNDEDYKSLPIIIFSALEDLSTIAAHETNKEVIVHSRYSNLFVINKPGMVNVDNVSQKLNHCLKDLIQPIVLSNRGK